MNARHWLMGLVASTCLVATATAQTTPGIDYNFDAAQDGNGVGDTVWTRVGLGATGERFTFESAATPAAVNDASVPGIFAAYGGVSGVGVSNQYDQGTPNRSRSESTFEIWFQANSLTGGQQVLFEAGGAGRGIVFSLNNANLEFLANGDNNALLSTTLSDTGWHQVVGTLHNISNDNTADDFISLYLDGVKIGDTSATPIEIDDFTGGNPSGLLGDGSNFATGGQLSADTTVSRELPFDGSVAIMRHYNSLLSDAQIAANHDFITNFNFWGTDADEDWNDAANWKAGVAPNSPTAKLAFTGGAVTESRTVNLDAAITASTVYFDSSIGYTIAGASTLTLANDASLNVVNGTHTIAAAIGGSAGLNKDGNGDLVLTGTNTYSGATTINDGNLRVQGAGAIPAASAVTVNAGGQLIFNGDGLGGGFDGTFANTIGGAGNVVTSNTLTSEVVTLSGANTYTGKTTLNGGTLRVTNSAALGAGGDDDTSNTAISFGGGTLELANNVNIATERIAPVDRDPDTEAHIVNVSGNNTLGGHIDGQGSNGGQYLIESTTGSLTMSGTLSAPDLAGETFVYIFDGAGDVTVNKITDADVDATGGVTTSAHANVAVVKRGSGTLTISTETDDVNDFWFGNTTIEAGTLAVTGDAGDKGELSASPVIQVNAGATFDVSDFGTYFIQEGQTLSGAGAITAQTVGFLEGSSLSPGDSVGTLDLAGGLNMLYFDSDESVVSNTGTLNFELGDSTATIGGAESDLVDITGNLTINMNGATPATDTWDVNVTAAQGTLATGSYTVMQYGGSLNLINATESNFAVSVVDAGGNALNTRATPTVDLDVAGQVNVVIDAGSMALTWSGGSTGSWDVAAGADFNGDSEQFFDLDTVTFDDTASVFNVNVANAVAPGGVTVDNTLNDYTLGGAAISTTGDLTKNGSGNATITNNGSTFGGDLNVNAGTLTFAHTSFSGLNGDWHVANGATLVINGPIGGSTTQSVTIDAGGTLQLGDGTLDINTLTDGGGYNIANDGEIVLNESAGGENIVGVLSGSGSLRVESGALQLNNSGNTFSGGATVNGGTLRLQGEGSAGAGAVTVNGAAFQVNGKTGAVANAVTLNGGEYRVGGGAGAAVDQAGNVTIGSASATIRTDGDSGSVGTPALTVSGNIGGAGGNDVNFQVGTNSTLRVTGDITHDGGLNKVNNNGTLELAGNNTYTGNTVVELGTLALTGGATLSGTPSIDMGDNTFDVSATTGGSFTLSGQAFKSGGAVTGSLEASAGSTVKVGGVAGGTAPLPIVTASLTLNYDAALDAPGDGTWDDAQTGNGDVNLLFGAAASTTAVADGTFQGLSAAYDISATGSALAPGASNAFLDGRAQSDGTFEVVFNVANTAAGTEQVLLDIGATRGVSLVLDNGTLKAGVNGDAAVTTGFTTALATGWHHAVIVLDDTDPADGSDDTFTLYVDNVQVGTLNTVDMDDWAGGNNWGIGGGANTLDPTDGTNQSLAAPANYHDQIAIVRFYEQAFDAADVNTNYQALLVDGSSFVDVSTLSISGDYTQDASSSLEVDTRGDGTHDTLAVGGTASLTGALAINAAEEPALGDAYVVLSSANIAGSFDNAQVSGTDLTDGNTAIAVLYEDTGVDTVADQVRLFATYRGDANGDGTVSLVDLNALGSAFGTGTTWQEGDFNYDGTVSLVDLNFIGTNFGSSIAAPAPGSAPAPAVPEPASLMVLGMGALALSRKRR